MFLVTWVSISARYKIDVRIIITRETVVVYSVRSKVNMYD